MPIFLCIALHLWVLLFYSIARIVFLLWNWSFFQFQSSSDLLGAFVGGLRFDISATAILTAPVFILATVLFLIQSFHKKTRWSSWVILGAFLLIHLPFFTLNFIDSEFVNFLGRRLTVDALFFSREVPGKFWSLILSYLPLALTWLVVSLGLIASGFLITKKFYFQRDYHKSLITAFSVVYLLALVVGARGGLQNKPINFAHAQIFSSPMMNNLLMNSSFTMIQSFKRQSLPRDVFFENQKEMLGYLDPAGSVLQPVKIAANKPNIVLIILESFALEYVGYAHEDRHGYTPFLDEISEKSIFFNHAFANARRSIEGIGAIMGGIPALMNEPFISSQYLTNYFLGVGTLLQKEGYDTSFFHGTKNGSMYFDQFMKSAGVQNYYGLNEYPEKNDFDGTWGIWDEPFLQWTASVLEGKKEPFFASIFTLSSHHPFKIPEHYQNRFPKGELDIHESIGYTDQALFQFFKTASQMPWFNKTIFIITADHTYKSVRPEYDNELGPYRVPLIIYSPGVKLPAVDESQIVQHIDILPTILDLVGAEQKERNHLGRSIFDLRDRFAINFLDNRYHLITKDYLIRYKRGGDFEMYSTQDFDLSQNLLEPKAEKEKLENRLKAAIQYFSQGLWDNKLYYPSGR